MQNHKKSSEKEKTKDSGVLYKQEQKPKQNNFW
jgi:hypothetical protein